MLISPQQGEIMIKYENDTLFLLAQNQFNDSRSFYEQHKQQLKQKATVPTRNLAAQLNEQLIKIDPKMNLTPTKMVSRIVRDTRFSKNKTLYRDCVWCRFMRPKNEWRYHSCMWFEFSPRYYDLGVGFFRCDPTLMARFRKTLQDPKNQNQFKKAIKSLEKFGAIGYVQQYKREKEGAELIEEQLKMYYNAKSFYFLKSSTDLEILFNGELLSEVEAGIKAFEPMYKFLLQITEKIIEEKYGELNEKLI